MIALLPPEHARDLLRALYLYHPERPTLASLGLYAFGDGWRLGFELPQSRRAPLCLAWLTPPMSADAACAFARELLAQASEGPRYSALRARVLLRIAAPKETTMHFDPLPLPEELFFRLVAADAAAAPDICVGRRLLLTLAHDGWRIAYCVPTYDPPGDWCPGMPPHGWLHRAWYPAPHDGQQPRVWPSLEMAADAAAEALRAIEAIEGYHVPAHALVMAIDPTAS